MRALAMGLAFIAAAPGAAFACSYVSNTYDRVQREPLDRLFQRSTYVETIQVSANGLQPCARRPSRAAKDEVWEAWVDAIPPQCSAPFSADADLTATVTERFKGQDGSSYPLHLGSSDQPSGFSDSRILGSEIADSIAESETARAATGHHDPVFWLQGDVGFAHDMSDSCGGSPVLLPGFSYVVFRKADGAVLAAEPVAASDDELLAWLHRTSGETLASPARLFTPAQVLAAASRLTLVAIERCEDQYGESTVIARPLRGTDSEVFPEGEAVEADGAQATFYLDEWLTHRGLDCAPRMVLVVTVYGAQKVWIPPMPAIVENGSVRVADLFPNVAVNGPERITVDEAFALFGSGRPD